MSNRHSFNFLFVGALAFSVLALITVSDRWADERAHEATNASAHQAALLRSGLLNSELQKFQLLPVVLPEYPDIANAFRDPKGPAVARVNNALASLSAKTDAAAIYLVDQSGYTIAASNWDSPDSFIGQRYDFRPYFEEAMANGSGQLFALGTVSGRAGLYITRRVDRGGQALGVLVVKVEFDGLEAIWRNQPGITAVADNHGVIIISSRPDWHFKALAPLTPEARRTIQRTRQFNMASLDVLDLGDGSGGTPRIAGEDYVRSTLAVPLLNARLINFQPLGPELRSARLLVREFFAAILLLLVICIALVVRSREKRSLQIAARKMLEAEVASRTAALRSANENLVAESQERARVERRFRHAREELAQANRLGSIGQITAGVAHEINQPVAAIRTYADNSLAFLDRSQAELARENISTIVSLTERIGAITAELRTFARRGTPTVGAVSLAEVIDGTLLLIGDAIRTEGILLEQRGTDTTLMVVADRVRLEQVMINLVQNAIQALRGIERPSIRLVVTDPATVLVADNGPGIDPSIATEIFTPFVTNKPDGLGLGLGIARDIVREFGGDIAIVASPLGGAAFELRLKRA